MLCCSLTSDKRVPLFVRSGAEIIQDRLVFAASNYKPLKQLRDAWAAAASDWLMKYESLKRAYDSEVEKLRVAEARAAASSGAKRGRGTGEEPPAKRMRVRSAQVAKDKYPGSLTVSPGDICTFIESCINPLWTRVKMDDDGRVGIISASRLVDEPDEVLPDPSDDEMPDPTDDEAEAEQHEQLDRERQDADFNERCQADAAAAAVADAEEEAAASAAAAEYAAAAAATDADL